MGGSTIRNKTSAIVLINVLLISIVTFSFGLSIGNVARILTGNYFADSFMNLVVNIPFLALFLLVRRSFKHILVFLLFFNTLWFCLDVISIVLGPFMPLFPPKEWQYVRSCVGANFLVFGFSIIGLVKWNIEKCDWLPKVGLFAPFISLCVVLVAMSQHGVSWLLFFD